MKRILALMPAALVGCSAGPDPWEMAAEMLPDQIAKARASGMPLELSDLGLPRNLSTETNAAPLYLQAIAAYKALPDRTNLEKRLNAAIAAQSMVPTVIRDRKQLQSIIRYALEATSKPACDFGRDWSRGYEVGFPEYADLNGVLKLLAADAVLDAKSGNFRLANDKLKACFRIADAICEEPTLTAMLVSIVLDGITYRRIEQIASGVNGSSEALASLRHTMSTKRRPKSLEWALAGQVVLGRITLMNLKGPKAFLQLTGSGTEQAAQPTGAKPPASLGSVPPKYFSRAGEARMLEYWRRAWLSIQKEDPLSSGKKIDELGKEAASKKDPTYIVPAILMPVFTGTGEAVVKNQIVVELTKAKIELLQYRIKTGRYPAKLSEIASLAKDPHTGKPFAYRQRGNGFVLYSVGPDGKDDGGRRAISMKTGRYDIVVEHPMDISKGNRT